MSNIKKLACPFKRHEGNHKWHKSMNERLTDELKNYHKEVQVIVGKDGWYYQAGECWYEFEGKAYKAISKDFIYQLELMNAGEHSKAEYLALKQLDRLNSKLLTEGQKMFLFYYGQHLHFKKMKAQTLVNIKAMKKRVLGGK